MLTKWYAVSTIMYAKFKDGNQNQFPVWENVILVVADSPDEALGKATRIAREEEGDSSGTFLYEKRPATMTFGGIRKVIECKNSESRPDDGTEITYSVLQVNTQEEFDKLIRGDPTLVLYEE